MEGQEKIDKQIPSVLENAFAKLTDRWADRLPGWMTPNQITAAGFALGTAGAACFALASLCRWLFIGAIVGVTAHILADNFDGYVARKRGKCSRAGAYFDIMSDVLVTTFCIIGIGLGGYAKIRIAIFLVPLYGIYYITALHSIYLLGTFPFPRMGPFAIPLSFIAVAVLNLVFGEITIELGSFSFNVTDCFLAGGLVIEAIELTELGVKLVRALEKR